MAEELTGIQAEKVRLASQGLKFALESARDWQTKVLGLQVLVTAAIGVLKAVATPETSILTAAIPWLAIVMFAAATAMTHFATGYLKVAQHWERTLETLLPGTFDGYREVLQRHYRPSSESAPAWTAAAVLIVAAALPALSMQHEHDYTLYFLLALSLVALVWALLAGAKVSA